MKEVITLLGIILCIAPFSTAQSQHPNILISSLRKPNEMAIAIDPANPNRMIAASNIANVYVSDNGGVTWKEMVQKSPYGVWGDPVIVFDTASAAYHFHLSNAPSGNWIDRIVCQKSIDGGMSFSEGTFFGLNGKKAQDKHWAVVNPKNNEIYVTWTQFDEYESRNPEDRSNILFSRSSDGGETWKEPLQINSVSGDCLDGDSTTEGAVPAVGPEGEIYVAWAGPNGLVFNRSFDGGETWESEEIKIGEIPHGWSIKVPGIYRANGLPITKCDLSTGPNRGTIYVNWADQRNGTDNTDIWLVKSEDRGTTWSEPIRVNQDSSEKHQFFTWMDVDQTNGDLFFIYHDRREYSDEKTDVYLAWSRDGGKHFKESKISESPFTPRDHIFFGDYNNIAVSNGIIRPVWTRLDEKNLSVHTALVDTNALYHGIEPSFQILTSPGGQPRLFLEEPSTVKIKVYGIDNQPIYTKEATSIPKEGYEIPLEENLKQGIYQISIQFKDQAFCRQWIKY